MTLMRAAVHIVSPHIKLELCTAYGRPGNMWKNDKTVSNLTVIDQVINFI